MENPCSHCEGTGQIMCPVCLGVGRAYEASLPDQECLRCHGARQVACPECGGSGVNEFTESDDLPGRVAP